LSKDRDPYLAAAGSFFLPGLGQVYSGRILRGIAFLIPGVLVTLPQILIQLSLYRIGSIPPLYTFWTAFYAFFNPAVDFVVRAFATYDAYNVAKTSRSEDFDMKPNHD
jgi:TM2 domain-containing membrane protein YozV